MPLRVSKPKGIVMPISFVLWRETPYPCLHQLATSTPLHAKIRIAGPLLTWLALSTKLCRADPLDSGEVRNLERLQVPWTARRCHSCPDSRRAERAKQRCEGISVADETWRQIQKTVQEPGLEAHLP